MRWWWRKEEESEQEEEEEEGEDIGKRNQSRNGVMISDEWTSPKSAASAQTALATALHTSGST